MRTLRYTTAVLLFALALIVVFEGDVRSQNIKSIEIKIQGKVDANRVRRAMKLREGDRYSPEAVDEALKSIWEIGSVRVPTIKTEKVDDGVKLIVEVTALPPVASVKFAGAEKLSILDLVDALSAPEGTPADERAFKADVQALQGYLRTKGYPLATVTQTAGETAAGWNVVYAISTGAELSVEKVRFEFANGQSFFDSELEKLMRTRGRGLLRKGEFDPQTFKSDVAAIEEFYRDMGFLDVEVGQRVDIDAQKARLFPIVLIREGPRYTIDQVAVTGSQFRQRALLDMMKLRSGDPFTQKALDHDLQALRDYYGESGYIRAKIEERIVYDTAKAKLSVEIAVVDEGKIMRVEQVQIQGNDITQDHVIRRTVVLHPGDPADPTKLERTRQRLENTGLFVPGSVKVRFEDTDDPERVNIVVDVDDSMRGHFTVGASWHSTYGLLGRIELVHNNFDIFDHPKDMRDMLEGTAFAGGGQKFSIRLSPGIDYHDYRLTWLEPSLNDTENSLGFEVYATLWSLEDYDEGRAGFNMTMGRRLADDKLTISATPGWERVTISDQSPTAPADAWVADGSHNRHYVKFSAEYNELDNTLKPSDGYVAGVDVTLVGTVLAGDVDALKERIYGRFYRTVAESDRWGKHVISIGGELAGAQEAGGGTIPIFERYKAGGRNSIRGFQYDGVGPVDPVFGKQVGGEYRMLANTEYEFPLYQDSVRGVFFVDTGSLGDSFGGFGDLRGAAGVGVRFDPLEKRRGRPTLPIALDLAFPFIRESSDETQAFSFSLGGGFTF